MLVTSVVGLLLTAVGAIAAPGGGGPPKHPQGHPPPPPPSVGPVNQIQTITCGGGDPYCCTPETDGWGSNYFQCSNYRESCNNIVVCCNSQNNQGSTSVQACTAFGDAKVIYN